MRRRGANTAHTQFGDGLVGRPTLHEVRMRKCTTHNTATNTDLVDGPSDRYRVLHARHPGVIELLASVAW